jgi:hypothetical protein
MLPGTAGANVRKTARYAGKDREPLQHLRRSSTPEQAHRELYEKLGVPEEIIRPRKRWVSVETCGE